MYKTLPEENMTPPEAIQGPAQAPPSGAEPGFGVKDVPGVPPGPAGASTDPEMSPPEELEDGYTDESINASPEEQFQYDILVTNAMRFIYGPGSKAVLKRMSMGRDPAMAVGQVAARIGIGQVQSAQAAGQKVGDAALFHAGHEIVGQLVELGEAARIFEDDGKMVDRAFYYAMDAFKREGQRLGLLDEAEIAEAGEIAQDVEGRMNGHPDIETVPKHVNAAMAQRDARRQFEPPTRRTVAGPDRGQKPPMPPAQGPTPGGPAPGRGLLEPY